MPTSEYYNPEYIARLGDGTTHRDAIGAMWEPMGNLQKEFLIRNGLTPSDRLLDIGCGSLRLGCKMVDHLEPGNYFGCDLLVELIDAGYRLELTDEQRVRLPRTNLWATDNFDFSSLSKKPNFAIAQSVFSHLPPAYLRLCLTQLHPHFETGGRFFATFFLAKPRHSIAESCVHPVPPGGEAVRTTAFSDPYHYWVADLRHAARQLPWSVNVIGDWNHLRGQQMVLFQKLDAYAAEEPAV